MDRTDKVILEVILKNCNDFIKISERKFWYYMSYLEQYERYEDMQKLINNKDLIISNHPE